MKESTTDQKILKEARRMLLRQGTKRFGSPEPAVLAALERITDIDHLENIGDRIFDANLDRRDGWLGLA